MIRLPSKTVSQLFVETVNLEFDYFISLIGDMSISEFGKRISVQDVGNNGMAFYYDNSCIFSVIPPDSGEPTYPIPTVKRFYLNAEMSGAVQ